MKFFSIKCPTPDLNDVVISPLSNVVGFSIPEANKMWTFKYSQLLFAGPSGE